MIVDWGCWVLGWEEREREKRIRFCSAWWNYGACCRSHGQRARLFRIPDATATVRSIAGCMHGISRLVVVTPLILLSFKVSSKQCNGGHVCSPPKECCSLGCCYAVFPQIHETILGLLKFMIITHWYLWAAILAGLALASLIVYCLCKRPYYSTTDDDCSSERTSAGPWFPPPHYSRCSSFAQNLPPPYNEVTAKPDLYPLVIGYDDGSGKGTSGFVMRYFRSLSHASTLDSLSSSFMCNMVNEANTIIPPPYSYNNSIDELSTGSCDRNVNAEGSSMASLANHRTTSDISSLAPQSPCSPPRATSPTLELRDLLDKIQQLPQLPLGRSTVLPSARGEGSSLEEGVGRDEVRIQGNNNTNTRPTTSHGSPSPEDSVGSCRTRRTRGKLYMPLGGLPPNAVGTRGKAKSKAKGWLSRSAPTTPSGNIPVSSFLLAGQGRKPSESDNKNHQVVPLLSEQDEAESNTTASPLPPRHHGSFEQT
ncbi:uncharacterized protein [Prorops nasuta]|uniref:uncharacterized protein n=1 Tax=Prorops nasuta TaxID=863751 RepID=UPI0034CF7AB2